MHAQAWRCLRLNRTYDRDFQFSSSFIKKSSIRACLLVLFLSMASFLTACQTSPNQSTTSVPKSQLQFIDLHSFDHDLSAALAAPLPTVDIAFYDRITPSALPERIKKMDGLGRKQWRKSAYHSTSVYRNRKKPAPLDQCCNYLVAYQLDDQGSVLAGRVQASTFLQCTNTAQGR